MKEECYFCKGTMLKKNITYDYWWKGALTLIENVPAWVCSQCGEEVLEGPVVEAMERVVRDKSQVKTIAIPLKRFDENSLIASP